MPFLTMEDQIYPHFMGNKKKAKTSCCLEESDSTTRVMECKEGVVILSHDFSPSLLLLAVILLPSHLQLLQNETKETMVESPSILQGFPNIFENVVAMKFFLFTFIS